MDPIAEIRRLYFEAKPATVARDFVRAIELLKTLPTEEERERAAVFMDGLSQMRSEWSAPAENDDRPRRRPQIGDATSKPAAKRR